MKLLLCRKCTAIFSLSHEPKNCDCGSVSGWYEPDGVHAVYTGDDAVPLGFTNTSFIAALENRPKSGRGSTFTAFVIPEVCPTARKKRLDRRKTK